MSREELIDKMAWAIRSRKYADANEQAREALAAIEQAGYAIVPAAPLDAGSAKP